MIIVQHTKPPIDDLIESLQGLYGRLGAEKLGLRVVAEKGLPPNLRIALQELNNASLCVSAALHLVKREKAQ